MKQLFTRGLAFDATQITKKVFTFIAVLLFQMHFTASGQTIAAWSPAGLSGYGPSPFTATTAATNTTIGGLTRGSGVGTSGTAAGSAWGGVNWSGASEAGSVTSGDFASFTIKANAGYSVSLSSLSLFYRRSGTGPANGQLQYSIDGTTYTDVTGGAFSYSSTSSSGAALPAVTLSTILALQNVPATTTITFRIVNWGGGSAGTWYVFSSGLSVSGTVNVATGCSGTPVAGTATVSAASVCGSGSSVVALSGAAVGTGIIYQWSSSATGLSGSFTNISGATSTTYVIPSLTTTTYYEAITTCTTSATSSTSSSASVVVNPLPAAISGTTTVCSGAVTNLTDDSTGGTWTSGNVAIATVNAAGAVTGISSGTAPITYALSTGCMTVTPLSVNSVVSPAGISPSTATVCAGDPATLLTAVPAVFSGGTNAVSGTINLSANSAGTAFPSALNISGIPAGATITNVAVTVNFTSSYVHDYVINLEAPNGNIINLAGQHAPTGAGSYTNTIFSSSGSTALSSGASPYTGTFSADAGLGIGGGGFASGVTSWTDLYSMPNGNWTIVPYNAYTSADVSTLVSWSIVITYTIPGSNTWSALAGLYTDATGTVAYTGTTADEIYAAPAATTTYTVTSAGGACSSATTLLFTVNPLPDAGTITGTMTVCPGATTSLSDAATGGTWSSADAISATVGASGTVMGIAAGSETVYYTVINSCGTAVDSMLVTVNPLPDAGTITGTATVCATATTSLSDAATGGTWSSADAIFATTDASGTITGIEAGTEEVYYIVTNSCGTAIDSVAVTVNPLPDAGTITGTTTVCATATTVLSDAATGGAWSSADAIFATVDASGMVTGIAAGTETVYYTVVNSCGTAVDSIIVTVNPLPDAGTITGTATVCATATTSLSDAATGGTWSSADATFATVDASGIVTGIAAGTEEIYYTVINSCGTAIDSVAISVNPLPDAGTITGTTTVCATTTTSLSDAAAGGTWSSADETFATTDASGMVTGITAGAETIYYTVTNSCGTAVYSVSVTVNPLPDAGSITGTATICPTATTLLSDAATGGTWSSVDPSFATVDATGMVTGVATGSATISYTVINSCGTAAATTLVTVSPLPDAGIITGTATVCPSATTLLTDATTGGTWSSVDLSFATINASGTVTGVTTGSATISYTVINSCGMAVATTLVSISPLPDAGTITGTATVCPTVTTLLSDAATGGTWSSTATGFATIDASGTVTGIAAGTTTISYTVINSCGTAAATMPVSVSPLPDAGSITGTATVCPSATTALIDAATGGTWSSSSSAFATVDASGMVTGIAAGSTTISYTVINSCGTTVATVPVTVNHLPDAGIITGSPVMCAGSTASLGDAAGGGVWSSPSPGVASVDASGTVTGVSSGVATISYVVTNSCGSATATTEATVYPLPFAFALSSGGSYCAGGAGIDITLSGSETGVDYQLFEDALPVGSPTPGTGSSVDFGSFTDAGTYSILATNTSSSCTSNMSGASIISVTPVVVPSVSLVSSAATDTSCAGATVTFTATATNGGSAPDYQWAVNGLPVTTAVTSYSYVPVDGDLIEVTLTNSDACAIPATVTAADTITVMPVAAPSLTIAVNANPACGGTPVTFTVVPVNGGNAPILTWVENGTDVATGTSYTYTPSAGDSVYCILQSSYVCALSDSAVSNGIVMAIITPAMPSLTISATPGTNIGMGQSDTLHANVTDGGAAPAYQWQANGVDIPGATSATYISDTFANNDVITCLVTNTDPCGYTTFQSVTIHISPVGVTQVTGETASINIIPNPNNGAFTVTGTWPTTTAMYADIDVTDVLGRVVYRDRVDLQNGAVKAKVQLNNILSKGVYIFNVRSDDQHKAIRFVVQ